MKPKWKLDNNILLHLLLEHNKLSKEHWSKMCYHQLNLHKAQHITRQTIPTPTDTHPERYKNTNIWSTPSHNIMATDYGRITQVERKVKPQPQRPTITVKKRKQHEKE